MKTLAFLLNLLRRFLILFYGVLGFANAQTPTLGTYQCLQNDNASEWRLELSEGAFKFGDLQGDWVLLSDEELADYGADPSTLPEAASVFRLDVEGEPRAVAVSLDTELALQTLDGLSLACQLSPSTQKPLNPLTQSTATPAQSPGSPTPEQLAAQGVDPEQTLIPDVFHCYEERASDDYSRHDFDLTILPGNRYSTPFGDGEFSVEADSILEVSWLSGPLASEHSYAFAGYNDYGQDISLYEIGADELAYNCYQRGPREEQAKLEWAFKDPQPGSYTCINTNDSSPGPTLELLENRRYRVDGQEGQYQVNIMSDPDDDLYSVDYLSGPWAEAYGNAFGNEATGERTISAVTQYGDFDCSRVGEPLQSIQYGAATAAPPPAGAGGLEGLYATWQPDVLGYCGGLCWSFYYFFPDGYVYTEEPDRPLEEIDCRRTRPNGLPLCDVYTLEGNTIYFSDGEPKSFARTEHGILIDGSEYNRILPVDKLQLNGEFRAFSYTPAVGGQQGGIAIEKTIIFRPDGTFTREGFVGASFTTTDTGTPFGDPVAGVTTSSESSNSGSYQIQGNTVSFKFNDGQVAKEFFFIMPGEDPASPQAIRVGSWDFTLQE
jgi:hypothetical protein